MSQGKLRLEDLVTQAPLEEEAGDVRAANGAALAEGGAAWDPDLQESPERPCCCLWRCFRPRQRSTAKLAAVVPLAPSEASQPSSSAASARPAAPREAPAAPPAAAAAAASQGTAAAAAAAVAAAVAAGPAVSAPVQGSACQAQALQTAAEDSPTGTAAAAAEQISREVPPGVEAAPGTDDEPGCQPVAGRGSRVLREGQEQPGQLGPQSGPNIGRKTLVLDLDETLIHSSFRPVQSADIVITVELEGEDHPVFVRKRPGVDHLLAEVSRLYEVVVYTASVPQYANKLLDELDKSGTVSFRLFRDACTRRPGGYVKDLSKLGRDLKDVVIVDNSPICYSMQPNNAIPIKTWRNDPNDQELLELIPILNSLAMVEDIPTVLQQIEWAADE
uniref:FCP1 homology domain-containing protein n=1 Tax=Alexandrium monilatum TaxID=311494 RepID=A0A7S4UXV8_9DINO|mmetsp:Transcript_28584/g.89069  ORF Transcript_28584/g.89069 Transcript_28584/m.89069 type:complete len:389 (-) Transcript_28584:21-1187(-)